MRKLDPSYMIVSISLGVAALVVLLTEVFGSAALAVPIAAAVGTFVFAWLWNNAHERRDPVGGVRNLAEGFSDGDSVEVDCRLCGQFNRVPAARLRDRPICGRCKTRLMPGKRVVICRTSRIEGPLRVELDALWSDEERLWSALAEHLAMRRRADRASEETRRNMVN